MPITFLSLSLYDKPMFAPLMTVLFWRPDTWFRPLFGACLCSNCWDQFSRTCRVFSLIFTLNTPQYFLDFALSLCYLQHCDKRKSRRSDLVLHVWYKHLHHKKSKKQSDNTITPTKNSITHWLLADLERSVEATTATQQVWWNRFSGSQPSHLP